MSIISHTSSNLIDPNDTTELTPENIKERAYGSKWVLVVEQMQIVTIWTIKFCLLIMYNRLTSVPSRPIVIEVLIGIVLTYQQHEFEAEPCRQDRGPVHHCRPRRHGDSLLWSLVPALLPVLGRPQRTVRRLHVVFSLMDANMVLSSMFRCDEPSYHQRRAQHIFRLDDYCHSNADFPKVPAPR